MKYLNFFRKLAPIAVSALVLNACDKPKTPEPMGDSGQTLVKFLTNYSLINVDFVPTPQTLVLADLRRDVPSATELGKEMTVIVKDDPGAVTAYDPALQPLPAGALTVDPSLPKTGSNYTMKMTSGVFAKEITATLNNATLLNLSNRYGVGFTIVSADANGNVTSSPRTIVIEIGAKNQWDGKYSCTFTNYHPSLNPTYGPQQTTDVEMRTTSANKVKIYWPAAGAYCQPAWLSGGFSYFGSQEPEYTINTSTYAVSVQNAFSGAVTFYTMAAGYPNRWDPATKTFIVKWGYSYASPGVWDAGCREWTQSIKYLGPR